MYSMVLVMALSGGAEVADCHNRCGCYGGYYGGCYGCYGGGSCYGCYGGWGGHHHHGGYHVGDYGGYYAGYQAAAPANIVVTMPTGGKLTIDGYVSTQTSSTRHLVTPALSHDQEFNYTLVAETTQDGKLVQQSQKVTVRAGQTVPVSFTFDTATITANR
jgi:uncharacterized protein (TIGR03000 family)